MTPGLPGTGIGGLFYLLLVLFMPLREVFRIQRGRGDRFRWRVIGAMLGLAGGILAALWLEAWVLFKVLGLRELSFLASPGISAEQAARLARAASVATLASLGLVMVALTVMRLLVRRPRPSALRCTAVRSAPAAAGSENLRAHHAPASSASHSRLDETAPVRRQVEAVGYRRLRVRVSTALIDPHLT